MDAFHDFEHRCPKCRAIIAKSTPYDRDAERKKGLKVVIGTLIGSIASVFALVIVYVALLLFLCC